MSSENLDFDLLAAFKSRFGLNQAPSNIEPETRVLRDAQYVYNNAIDVFIDRAGTQSAAEFIRTSMQQRSYSQSSWSAHELHPSAEEFGEEATVSFIFTLDLLNFSFWSDAISTHEKFCVRYAGKQWTGYWSLVAALRRALEARTPITSSDFWQCEEECNLDLLRYVFRSETDEEIPLLQERLECLQEAGTVLYKKYDCNFINCIRKANGSAAELVNMLANDFRSFRDEFKWEDEKVRFLKRAQILVADLWACFKGKGPGYFHDIDTITAFADYRMPQMLHSLGCLSFSPPLENRMRQKVSINPGHSWEVQLRGCSIWAVELIRREILKKTPDAAINAILIDFFLYDLCKEREASASIEPYEMIPHHRTRSIYY